MNYRWEVEEAEAPRAPSGRNAWDPASQEPEGQEGPSPEARKRLLKTLALTIVLGFVAAIGWRWWAGQRLIREIERDVSAAVMLEEKAVAEGDWKLFVQRQSRSRARKLRAAQRAYGKQMMHPPIGGLRIESAEPELQAIEVDTDVPAGAPIRRVTVTLEHRVADGFGGGAFAEARPYVLSSKGNWIHTFAPDRVDRVEAWQGERIDARFFADEQEAVAPLLRRADEILARFCEAAGHCGRALTSRERRNTRRPASSRSPGTSSEGAGDDREPYRVPLSLTGEVPGAFGYEVHDRQRFLRIPSPARTWAPADAEAEATWVRELARIAALDLAEAVSGDVFLNRSGTPSHDPNSRASLLLAMFDRWMVSEGLAPETEPAQDPPEESVAEGGEGDGGEREPTRDASRYAALHAEVDPDRPTFHQLWPSVGFTTGTSADDFEERQHHISTLARYLDEEGGGSALAALLGSLPDAGGPILWLEAAFGPAAMQTALKWNGALDPFAADRALTLRCAPAVTEPGILLYQPGAEGPIDLGPSACGRDASLAASWRPADADRRSDLAVICADGYDIVAATAGRDEPESGFSNPVLALLPDASLAFSKDAPAAEPVRISIDDVRLRHPSGLSWSADGEYLALITTIPYGNAPALRIIGVDDDVLRGERAPTMSNIFIRSWGNMVELSQEPRVSVASEVRFRWAPVGRRIVMETRDKSVAVVELKPLDEVREWQEQFTPPTPEAADEADADAGDADEGNADGQNEGVAAGGTSEGEADTSQDGADDEAELQAGAGVERTAPLWRSPGHDPVWSPDGSRIAMIAPANEAAPGTIRMKVLDSETGVEITAADFDLPEQLSAQAESEGLVPDFEYIRVRVGDWSPDGELASMAVTARLEVDASSTQPRGRIDIDWIGLATLDTTTGVTRQASGKGSAYLEGRGRFTFWTGEEDAGDRRVTLTYYDPEWMAGLQAVIQSEPEIVGSEDPPVGISLNVDKGASGPITVQEAIDAGLPASFDSPDERWALRVEGRVLGGTPDYGLALVDREADSGGEDGASEPVWRLRGNWCNEVRWAP